MFNHEPYKEMVDKFRAEIAAGDDAWRATVGVRYGRFLIRQAAEKLKNVETALGNVDFVEDRDKFYSYYSSQIGEWIQRLEHARRLITSQQQPNDPTECEIALRVYAECTRQQTS